MKFLLSAAGIVDHRFGILTTPAHGGIVSGIAAGMVWAADNEAYTRPFDPDRFFPWLEKLLPYRATCLFVSVPDVVGDAVATTKNYNVWHDHFSGWPMAYVAQDGAESLPFPGDCECVFIGGSTAWKLGSGADECIRRGLALGKRIHIGRVNWAVRYRHFLLLDGSENFTADGTRQRFEGVKRTIEQWSHYMKIRPLLSI